MLKRTLHKPSLVKHLARCILWRDDLVLSGVRQESWSLNRVSFTRASLPVGKNGPVISLQTTVRYWQCDSLKHFLLGDWGVSNIVKIKLFLVCTLFKTDSLVVFNVDATFCLVTRCNHVQMYGRNLPFSRSFVGRTLITTFTLCDALAGLAKSCSFFSELAWLFVSDCGMFIHDLWKLSDGLLIL